MKTKFKYFILGSIIVISFLSLSISIPLVLKQNKNLRTIVPEPHLFYKYNSDINQNQSNTQIIEQKFLSHNKNQIFVLPDQGADLRYFEINQILNIASNLKKENIIQNLKSKIYNIPNLEFVSILNLPYYLNIAFTLNLNINIDEIKKYLLKYTKIIDNHRFLIVNEDENVNLTFIWNLYYVFNKHNINFESNFFSLKWQIQKEVQNFQFDFNAKDGISSWNSGNNLLALLKYFNNIKISESKKEEIQTWIKKWSDFYRNENKHSIDEAEFYYWSEKFNKINLSKKEEIINFLKSIIKNQKNISLLNINSITEILKNYLNKIDSNYIEIIESKTQLFLNDNLAFYPISIKNTFFAYQILKNKYLDFKKIKNKLKSAINNKYQQMIQKNDQDFFVDNFSLEELYFYIAFLDNEDKSRIIQNQQLTSLGKKLETLSIISFNYINSLQDLFFAAKISSYFASITKINRTIDEKLFQMFSKTDLNSEEQPIWTVFVDYFFKKIFNVKISSKPLIESITNNLLNLKKEQNEDNIWEYLEQNETLESLFFSINELKNFNQFFNLKTIIAQIKEAVLSIENILQKRIKNNESVRIADIYYSEQLLNLIKKN